MTGTTVRELAAALRGRYLHGSKLEKGRLLDQFCQITGYHRKSAVRLLCHPPKARTKGSGRRKEHGADLAEALRTAWDTTDRVCSKKLQSAQVRGPGPARMQRT